MSPKTIADYLSGIHPAALPVVGELRSLITSTIPDAEETISWNVPIYKYHGILAGISVARKHVSFGVDSLSSENRKSLHEKGYKTGKKTIQIKFNQEVPLFEIKDSLKTQAKINKAQRTK